MSVGWRCAVLSHGIMPEADGGLGSQGGSRLRASPRQLEILALIAIGKSDTEIASALGISFCTVRSHLQRLYQNHNVHTRAEAVATWLRNYS
jgi:DNA-binding NarL/FixJ family response regulator